MKLRLTVTAVLALAILAVPAAAAGGGKPPRVVRALLEKGDRGQSFGFSLSANVKRADTVTFKTKYNGDAATGAARYNDNVTTTDLRGEASHPWQLIRKGDGKDVIRLIRQALNATGETTVKIKMRDEGGRRFTQPVTFVESECHKDPPIYPLTCTVEP